MNEQRTIMVANTKTQKRYKISTNASTLGELKSVLRDNNIDYTDMAFTEGITKSVLTDDNAPLPTNIPYKGNVTNNLVLLLTNTSKKIASGLSDERLHFYMEVKAKGLENVIKETFGKNFTQVKTDDLRNFLTDHRIKVTGTVLEEADLEDTLNDNHTSATKEIADELSNIKERLYSITGRLNSIIEKLD